jgi:hypothetical protein
MEGADKAADTFNTAFENKIYCIFNTLEQVLYLEISSFVS